MAAIRVLIVDDSAVVRSTLSAILATDRGIEVMATASDPFVAAERMRVEVPDVIVLDVEMPRMDGHHVSAQTHEPAADPGDHVLQPDGKGRGNDVEGTGIRGGGHHHQAEAGDGRVPAGVAGAPDRDGQGGGGGAGAPPAAGAYGGAETDGGRGDCARAGQRGDGPNHRKSGAGRRFNGRHRSVARAARSNCRRMRPES